LLDTPLYVLEELVIVEEQLKVRVNEFFLEIAGL
jgi:hypothetical protein